MEIKVSRQPEPKKIDACTFQGLKKQCLKDRKGDNSSTVSSQSAKNSQYLQVNYLKDFVYKISPETHSKVPLLKQEQNFRDYLLEIQTDQQKLHQVNNQIKYKYFLKDKTSTKISRQIQRKDTQINVKKIGTKNSMRQNDIYLFDPIEYLENKRKKLQKKLLSRTKKFQQTHSFADDVQSVKYISQAPQIKLPKTLPFLAEKQSTDSLFTQQQQNRHKTHYQIGESINQILQKSIKIQSQSKLNSKKMRSCKSRSQLQKQTENKIKTERKSIIKMIENSQRNKSQQKTHRNSIQSVDQVPAKQKYAIDFISYVRTKTKDQIDKYVYEKLVKQPERDLQKFQQFMLKQVKFQNEENKNKMERFFIKMREQFRRIEKYNKKGSKFDWRSKSMHLDQMKKQDQKLQKSKLFEEKILKNLQNQNYLISKSNTTFLDNLQGKRLKSKVDRIMQQYIRLRNQKLKEMTEEMYKRQEVLTNQDEENQEIIS